MVKNIFNFTILILLLLSLVFVITHYLSEKNKKKVLLNRVDIDNKIFNKIENLPILKNDTNNVIEFNSGFQLDNEKKIKRKFWELIRSK
jgi:hypothetical protein|tara:strand:+ start:30 stop:296 length:267 start_codon:yes stop_codon:yes gene_type:complete